jgi:dephospho-CoA kinase
VIESYPGAAQDILGIPRKRASLELLARGLAAFGISGSFSTNAVSHDELDAITSAVVGLFFWAGRFEALGNDNEEFLIIPEIASGEARWRGMLAIGLSGPIGAGKTTAGEYLRDRHGFKYARYSEVIDAIAQERGLELTREVKQAIGLEINQSGGQRRLGHSLLALLSGNPRVVIDGMRHPEDHAFLMEAFGPRFHHITLDASRELRRDRAVRAGITASDFDEAVGHAVEANVERLTLLAKHRIGNSGTLEDLGKSLDDILRNTIEVPAHEG